MATLTEIALFKACVENPQYLKKPDDLNLDRISDPSNAHELDEFEIFCKKAIKLFHMSWSGITKYMRTVCQVKCKPVEFPGLGIFLPVAGSG